MCIFANVFAKSHFYTTLFVGCQIHFNKLYLFFTQWLLFQWKKLELLDFGVRDVAFEAKVFNRYGTFDRIANKNMEDPSYAYLHCDLLDRVVVTIITLKVKSPHIDMMSNTCKKTCWWGSKILALSHNPKRDFMIKATCMLSLQLNLMTIVSPIIGFEPKLVPMFFHMDSIKIFKSSLQNWSFTTIIIIINDVKGGGNNKGEKQL